MNISVESLAEDLFGSMMTSLERDVLPFPHVDGIDLGPSMQRKVFLSLSLSSPDDADPFVLVEFHRGRYLSLRR